MSITSIVMIAAFAIIYFITYNNINSEIKAKLNTQSSMQMSIEEPNLPGNIQKYGSASLNKAHIASLDSSLSFNIEVDENGKVLGINSFIDIPIEAYYKAAESAWNNKNSNSAITIEGKQWRYSTVISKKINSQIIEGEKSVTSVENKYLINFLDVTSYNKTLLQLLTTLSFVGLTMLFIIFIISLYFANRAIKPIEETWQKQKQFVADASHELKTPLSIINANYDALLANKEETIKSQLKWLDYIRIGTDRMTKLINDLLSLAKIDDAKFEVQKIPFNISSAVNDVLSSMEAVVLEKGINLSHSIDPEIIIKGDSERIKQVVTILFDNAVKYSNENGEIDISLTKSKRQVIFSIKNSGKGIPKQDLPKVFDRFYRADLSRTHEDGSYGLGLSIAKTIIDRLGGEIHVSSIENEYTTFTFTLGL